MLRGSQFPAFPPLPHIPGTWDPPLQPVPRLSQGSLSQTPPHVTWGQLANYLEHLPLKAPNGVREGFTIAPWSSHLLHLLPRLHPGGRERGFPEPQSNAALPLLEAPEDPQRCSAPHCLRLVLQPSLF